MEKKRARTEKAVFVSKTYPLLGDVLAQFSGALLELLAGFQKIVGVVDDVRGHEENQLAAIVAIGFAAEYPAHVGEAVQSGNAGRCAGGVFGNNPADGDRVAVLQRDLGLHHLLIKRWRGNTGGSSRGGIADLLVDDQRDHA